MANTSKMTDEYVDGGGFEEYFCPDMFDFHTFNGVFFILIFIFSLICNVLLVGVLFVSRDLKNVTNFFILNLACSDLIFTITLPFWTVDHLHEWVFGDFACKFKTAAYYAGMYSSVILMTAMTVDRFTAVSLPSRPSNPVRRQRCAVVSCAAAWIISIAVSISDAVKVEAIVWENNVTECIDNSEDHDVVLGFQLQMSLLFILPFTIIVFCYSAILRTVLQATNRKRYRTVMVVLCIVAAFFICWGPYNILIFFYSFYNLDGCSANERFHMAFNICRILAYSHCFMNPLLCMLSQKLRGHLLQLLRCNTAATISLERGTTQRTSVIQNVAFIAQSSVVVMEKPSK